MIPKGRPNLLLEEALAYIPDTIDRKKYPVVLLGIRGYYMNTMGVKGKNDRGIYDDAAFWITPSAYASFNFNTDPRAYRKGRGIKEGEKGMAVLNAGVWMYKAGLHKGYQAFRQADQVTVTRDGLDGNYEDTGWFGINIHKGGIVTTSSAGCQTLPVAQWHAFKDMGYDQLKLYQQHEFPYVLVEQSNG